MDIHDEANIGFRRFAKSSKVVMLSYKLEEKRLIFTVIDFVFEKIYTLFIHENEFEPLVIQWQLRLMNVYVTILVI
jgi:hypothetical protein